jgi:hypothetical protein
MQAADASGLSHTSFHIPEEVTTLFMAIKTNPLLKSQNEIKDAVENLRTTVRDITNAFVNRTEAEIVALSAAMSDLPAPEGDAKHTRRQEKILEEMHTLVAQLKVKPEKGRLKDLRRVRDALDELNELAQKFSK